MAVQQKDSFRLAATGDTILTRELLPYEGVSDRFERMVQTLREPTPQWLI